MVFIKLLQIAFFLLFGLISGAAISSYCDHERIIAISQVYLSMPPSALTQVNI